MVSPAAMYFLYEKRPPYDERSYMYYKIRALLSRRTALCLRLQRLTRLYQCA